MINKIIGFSAEFLLIRVIVAQKKLGLTEGEDETNISPEFVRSFATLNSNDLSDKNDESLLKIYL